VCGLACCRWACAVRQRPCSPKPYRTLPPSITFSAVSPFPSVHQPLLLPCPWLPYRFKRSRSRCPRVMAYVRTRLCFHHSPALLPIMSTGLEVPMPYCVSVGKAFWGRQLQPILPAILSSRCILPTILLTTNINPPGWQHLVPAVQHHHDGPSQLTCQWPGPELTTVPLRTVSSSGFGISLSQPLLNHT
jgi:hypothetical protein